MSAPLSELGNDRIRDGGNIDPFTAHQINLEDIRAEASNWLDGGKITSPEEAEAVDTLLDMARKASKAADDARTEEKEPHLKAGREVDAKWKPLITQATTIADVCKQVLAPWRIAEAARKEAAAALARAEADRERQAEVAATRAASGNIDARETAGQLAESAKAAEKVATSLEKAAGKGNGLRTVRTLVVTDARALAGWLWKHRREQTEEAHAEIAQGIFRASTRGHGSADIDGTKIIETQKAV